VPRIRGSRNDRGGEVVPPYVRSQLSHVAWLRLNRDHPTVGATRACAKNGHVADVGADVEERRSSPEVCSQECALGRLPASVGFERRADHLICPVHEERPDFGLDLADEPAANGEGTGPSATSD
jgi:hypothetical protein